PTRRSADLHTTPGQCTKNIPAIVETGVRIPKGIKHLCAIRQGAGVNAGTVSKPLVTGATTVGHQAFCGKQQSDAISRCGPLTGSGGLLTYSYHGQIASDSRTRTATGSARYPFGIVWVAGLTTPRAQFLTA